MSVKYAKGEKPKDMDAAKGGLVLDRLRSFTKEDEDDLYPLGTGKYGPENEPSYAKTKGKNDPPANRTGTKSLPVIKPRS